MIFILLQLFSIFPNFLQQAELILQIIVNVVPERKKTFCKDNNHMCTFVIIKKGEFGGLYGKAY